LAKDTASKIFQCELCGVFVIVDSSWTDADAAAEAVKNYGTDIVENLEPAGLVCDECYYGKLGFPREHSGAN
jgi:hypothetical protein